MSKCIKNNVLGKIAQDNLVEPTFLERLRYFLFPSCKNLFTIDFCKNYTIPLILSFPTSFEFIFFERMGQPAKVLQDK
jgi:hypothetical protein